MPSADIPRLIDESPDLAIDDSYDPLITSSFEEHIQITERVNPGKRKFNNRPGVVTRNVQVVGLVLRWGADTPKRLKALVGRDNVEKLTLYADTVVIDATLHFPQTNVTIYARRLMFGIDGALDTTPLAFADPYARGSDPDDRPDKMKPGGHGDRAGDVTLYVREADVRPGMDRFILKGSAGQHGEKGGLRKRKTVDASKVPVSWEKIKDEVISHDVISRSDTLWNWPDDLKAVAERGDIYYIELHARNFKRTFDMTKSVELGDKDAENTANGLDAYASGTGGNGGAGGTLSSTFKWNPPHMIAVDGGKRGESTFIPGTAKSASTQRQRMWVNVCHKTPGSCSNWSTERKNGILPNEFKFPNIYRREFLDARDGNSAQGQHGTAGANGSIAWLDDPHQWLHPFIVGTIVQYVRDTWLAGDRRPARWLLPIYQDALRKAEAEKPALFGNTQTPSATLPNTSLRNLSGDVDLMLARVRNNLDYFGNPVGWIPRLGAVANIDILTKSRPAMTQLLYYAAKLTRESDLSEQHADELEFLIHQLDAERKTARADLLAAQTQLPAIKTALDALAVKLGTELEAIQKLNDRIVNELKLEAQEQQVFSGSCKLVGALCHFIPVGQPYLGEIASGLTDEIAKIDIHKPNPFDIMETTAKVSGKLGEYMTTYKDEITTDATKGLAKKISLAKDSIEDLDGEIKTHQSELKTSQAELEALFGDDLSIMRTRLEKLRSARSLDEAKFYDSSEYTQLIRYTAELEQGLSDKESTDTIPPEKRKELSGKLKKLRETKGELAENIKTWEKKKETRGKKIEDASKTLVRVGKGITGVADGLRTMMKPIDATSEEFLAKVEAAKDSAHKAEFKEIYDRVSKLNAERLKQAKRLFKLESRIAGACQTLAANLEASADLSDDRVRETGRQLRPSTQLFIRRMASDTWALLRAEMYYLVKSYQYRFLRRADPEMYNVESLIRDIDKFFTDNGTTEPDETAFEEAFDAVIQANLLRLALDLLTNRMQNVPRRKTGTWVLALADPDNGRHPLLEALSQQKKVSFRLHQLGTDSKGTGEEFDYRLSGVQFTGITVEVSPAAKAKIPDAEKRISFRLSLAHSGESVLRAQNGEHYFFTTRNPESSDIQVQNVHSWSAAFNGANVDRKDESAALTNEEPSTSDESVLTKLLSQIGRSEKIEYDEHLPGATSLLTLSIDKNNLDVDFDITSLTLNVDYEWLPNVEPKLRGKRKAVAAGA